VDLDSGDTWQWIWLAATALFALSELAVPGTFFMLSFAAGAAAASIAAFLGADVALSWIVFVGGTAVALALLLPLARRFNRPEGPPGRGEGADRWVGRLAVVIGEIPEGAHNTGTVRIEREEWRAESVDGAPVEVGVQVEVLRVDGTRLVVTPTDSPA
jgi:membrane protein implicated in regulation of membrane protease activity